MKVKLTVIFLIISICFTPLAGAKMVKQGTGFIGLWQGVDPLDGSEVFRSITLDENGNFNIIGSETYFSGCGSDRGIVEATGYLENGVLKTSVYTLTCYEIDKTISVDAEYVRDKENGTLTEVIGGDFPPPPVILHRISTKK